MIRSLVYFGLVFGVGVILGFIRVLVVEFSVVLGLEDLSVREYLAERDPVAGAVYGVMLMICAAMPWVLGKGRAAARGGGNP